MKDRFKGPTTFHRFCWGLLLFTLSLVLSFPTGGAVHAESLRVGYFRVSPHAMPDDSGQAQGVAVDYFKRIAAKMGIADLEFQLFPLERLLVALAQEEVDMALLLGKNSQREAVYVYPRQPFCITQPCIAVRADGPLTAIRSAEPLRSMSIQESAKAFRSAFIRDHQIRLESLHGDNYTARCFAKLLADRIDACYQPDHFPLLFEAALPHYTSRIRILRLPEPPIGLYSTFSKKSAPLHLEAYEAALAEVAGEMTYESAFQAFKGQLVIP